MSWQDDSGRHEGYSAYITVDDREPVATSGRGMHMHHDHTTGDDYGCVPWDRLLGWEARCTCGWVGPMWRRPEGADLKDASEMVLADPLDAFAVEAGDAEPTAEDAVHVLWRAHVAAAEARRRPRHRVAS